MIKRWLRLLLGALLTTAAWFGAASAGADGGSNEVGACLASGQVWLLVTTAEDDVLANQCVGTPATGIDSLAAGGMRLELGKGSLVCTIGGYPEGCPRTFTGTYWAYYQGTPGKAYHYSDKGAQAAIPQPGTIEAWCYNKPTEERCIPPQLNVVLGGSPIAPPAGTQAQDFAVTQNRAVSPPSGTPWPTIAVGAFIVFSVTGLLLWRRRVSRGPELGGR